MKKILTVILAAMLLFASIPIFASPATKNSSKHEDCDRDHNNNHDHIPVPIINIVAPVNGYTTDKNTLNVKIHFQSSAKDKKGKCQGNVKTIVILLDSHMVVKYKNPPQVKENTKTFTLNISRCAEGEHVLNAFAYRENLCEKHGQAAPVTFIIKRLTPVNRPPQITSTAVTTAKEGQPYTYQVAAVDPDAGDVLTYALVTAPNGMNINSSSGLITWTPSSGQIGSIDVTVKVTDKGGLSAIQPFTIIVEKANNPPIPTPQSGFIHGVVIDSDTELVVTDAHLTIPGVQGVALTDTNGEFSFPTPGSGEFTILISKDGYITSERTVKVVSTRNASVDKVYVKHLDPAMTTITNAGGTHSNAAGTLLFTFPANVLPDGVNSIDVRTTLYEKDRELLAPLPKTTIFTYAFKVLPDKVKFKQPVSVRLANSLGFAPGTSIPIGYYNPDTHKWEDTGTSGIISSDGAWLDFQLTHFCGYDCNFPAYTQSEKSPSAYNRTANSNANDKVCAKDPRNSLVRLKSGELSMDHSLPPVKILNQNFGLTFFYNSYAANPINVIAADTELDALTTLVPLSTSIKLDIEGRTINSTFKGTSDIARYPYLFDNTNSSGQKLATGSYAYTMEVSNNYSVTYGSASYFGGPATGNTGIPARSPVSLTSTISGRIVVNNQQDSPYGSGWSLQGLQRLYFDPDGAILLTEGEGSSKTFTKPQGKHVVMSGLTTNHISVLIGNNDGTFRDPGNYPAINEAYSTIVNADFNQDGITDLAVTNHDSYSISVFLGKGDGTFQAPVEYSTGDNSYGGPMGMIIADFNGDSFADLAVANYAKGISILMSNGNGTFQSPVNYLAGNYPRSITSGDFNHDGVVDIAVGDYDTIISILLGNGNGTFQDQITQPVRGVASIIKSADFNRDGTDDLVIAWSIFNGPMGILLGNGDGTFREGEFWNRNNPRAIAIADFNGDSYADMVVTGVQTYGGLDGFYLHLGKGDGTFQAPVWYPVGAFPGAIGVADFNGDLKDDIAVWNTGYSYSLMCVYSGNGDGTFSGKIYSHTGAAYNNYGEGSLLFNVCVFDITSPGVTSDYFLPPAGEYSSLKKNADNTYTRFLKDGSQILFNAQGLQIQAKDKNNNIITYNYIDANSDGKVEELAAIILPTGALYQFNYTNGKLSGITDPAARVTGFTVDSQGDLTRIVNADGTSRYFTYDANHLMTRKTDERGNSAEYFYDRYGAIREVFSPEREVTEIAADGTVTTSRKIERRKYGISNVKSLINDLPAGTGIPENPADVVRPQDITEQIVDGKGNTWKYQTNQFGGRLQYSDPLNNVTNYERDSNSNLISLTRAKGMTSGMFYDSLGNLIATRKNLYYDYMETKITYEPKYNQPTSITDPLGNMTLIDYDSKGNPNKITDSSGTITTMEYNTHGQVTKVISAFGTTLENQTMFAYDPVTFNLTSITDPLSHTTSFIYNSAGNVEQITDANGKISTFTYDPMNRVKIARDADGKVTSYTYDNLGNLVSVTDANNHTTTFTYDEQNQLTKTTNPLNEQKLYAYDINRNLSMVVTPKGAQIKLYNNAANMVEKKFLAEGEVDYTYDAEYNLTRVTNEDSDLTFAYDLLSRLIQAQTAVPATSISYSYDVNNNLVSMTNPAGIVTNYIYDTLNRLTDIKDQANQVISHYDYDALSRRTGKSFAVSGLPFAVNYQYDLASQLLAITNLPTSIANAYTYDNVGNRLSLTDNNGIHNYNYDNVYRLLNSTNPNEAYTYDPVGNRNALINNYDGGNRLLDDDIYTYTYDLDGNMTSKVKKVGGETTTYTYNSEDQLIGVNNNISYKYDALGRRIEKNVSSTITRYVYDGEDIIQELDGNNQVITTYIHGPSIDEPILLEKNSQKYYYISDGLGSNTALVDQNGNIAQTYRYDSFGNIISSTGSLSQPYTYTGREYDTETGLYYYRARYYDAKIGRFLQEDPVWGQNLYSYCGNDPINLLDPLGLYWQYSQSTGELKYFDNVTLQYTLVGKGYSGKNVGSQRGLNNPNMQQVKDLGPIPAGYWVIGKAYSHKELGKLTMDLYPFKETNTFDRDRYLFRIHGDKEFPLFDASTGCIIFNKKIRKMINDCDDKILQVVR